MPEKLSRIYKRDSNICWKCEQHEEIFYLAWETCKKNKKMDPNIYFELEDVKDECSIEAKMFPFMIAE